MSAEQPSPETVDPLIWMDQMLDQHMVDDYLAIQKAYRFYGIESARFSTQGGEPHWDIYATICTPGWELANDYRAGRISALAVNDTLNLIVDNYFTVWESPRQQGSI